MISSTFACTVQIGRRSLHTQFSRLLTSVQQTKMGENLHVVHDTQKKEFTLKLEGSSEPAIIEYTERSDNSVDLHHTEVPVSYRGRGIAKVLAKNALDYFASSQVKMRLSCTYLQKYVKDNPNPTYLQYLVEKWGFNRIDAKDHRWEELWRPKNKMSEKV